MKILFENINILGFGIGNVAVENEIISYVGATRLEKKEYFDRVIDGSGKLLMPGLYNCHTHAAMTLFRGYGEDMTLQSWLETKIFPAEDLLTNEAVYVASLFAIAEMIKNGIVSFSDMYFFCDQTVKAAAETGIKANISRSIVSFDPDIDMNNDSRFIEAKKLFYDYHNAENGRIKIDMALHAEYSNVKKACEAVADFSRSNDIINHVHLSETESEHNECIARHKRTPAEFFLDCGIFDSKTLAAHCVYATESDMDIFAEKGVVPVYNPASNLKLGSGIFPLQKAFDRNIRVAIGTDGTASNNTLDILKDMHIGAILQKGASKKPDEIKAEEIVQLATENGAYAQGRNDCGRIKEGCRADITVLDLDAVNNIPMYNPMYTVVYSADSSNVLLTMCDGKILYENGEYKTIDIEKLKHDMKKTCGEYFRK